MKWADFVKERVVPAANVENVAKLLASVVSRGRDSLLCYYVKAGQSRIGWLKANRSLQNKGRLRLPRWPV